MTTLERAVVIGGSLAGLATAAALSPRAREVVVVERRRPGSAGTVAPQAHLPHVMLAAGQRVLEDLFPGFHSDLLASGASDGGGDPVRVPCHWVAAGTRRDHLPIPDLGFPRALASRALVETHLRSRVTGLPNVTLLDASADGLEIGDLPSRGVVSGVWVRGMQQPIRGDLVIDAAGRNSRVPEWLAAAGLPTPAQTEVVVDLRYTAFVVQRRAADFGGAALAVIQNTRDLARIGVALPMEHDRWQVVLGGYFGDGAPTDPEAARAFARSLPDPSLSRILDRPYLAAPARYTFRSSQRRHWEQLRTPTRGLCAVGDSVASFNPIYGQGMSSALLQAEALGAAIDRHEMGDVPRRFARAAAKVVATPWTTATGADFGYSATQGQRPPGNALVNRYVERVMRAAASDERANAALTAVQQLLAAPPALFRPGVVASALRRGGRRLEPHSASVTTASVGAAV